MKTLLKTEVGFFHKFVDLFFGGLRGNLKPFLSLKDLIMNRLDIVSAYYGSLESYGRSTKVSQRLGYEEVISKKTFRHDCVLNEKAFVIDCFFIRVAVKCENLHFCRLIKSKVSFHDNITVYRCEFVGCKIKLLETTKGLNEYKDCVFVDCEFKDFAKATTKFVNCKFVECLGMTGRDLEGNWVETQ
jgi:hypothetical protein